MENKDEKKIKFCDKCGEAYQTDKEHKCHYTTEKQILLHLIKIAEKYYAEFSAMHKPKKVKKIIDQAKELCKIK